MELILIYFFLKIKTKTAEIAHNGVSYISLLFLFWFFGEVVGFILGSVLVSSWLLRYLSGACCGIGAGWLIYRKAMSLEQTEPDYFDLGQSKAYPYVDAGAESITPKTNIIELLKERKKVKTEPLPVQQSPRQNGSPNIASTNRMEFMPDNKEEIKFDFRSEDEGMAQSGFQATQQTTTQSSSMTDTNIGFGVPKKTDSEANAPTIKNIFKFPYSELFSVSELLIDEYGVQTVKDHAVSERRWFGMFKDKYQCREFNAAIMILENALQEDLNDGFIWLLFGVFYKEVYRDFDKALQFCLSGAKRCNTYKIALLTEAAELLLIGKKDVLNAFKFFCLAIIAITDVSKTWGNPEADGHVTQERAFLFIRILLTAFNFNDYRLYLERNIRFSTSLDQALIENVLAICTESPFKTEIEQYITRLFPLIIEKVQALG